jgi:hypothetical protein
MNEWMDGCMYGCMDDGRGGGGDDQMIMTTTTVIIILFKLKYINQFL